MMVEKDEVKICLILVEWVEVEVKWMLGEYIFLKLEEEYGICCEIFFRYFKK